MVAEGVEAAEARRVALHALIADDPEAALRAAVPWPVRVALPESVRGLLEEVVGGVGDFRVVAALPATAGSEPEFRAVRREALLDERRFEVFPAGRRKGMPSRVDIAMHGIAIDGRMAMADTPVRVLDPGEPTPQGREVDAFCGVSGAASGPESIPAGQPVVAVDTGRRVVHLCSAGHIAAFAASLEGGTAAAGYAATATIGATGVKRLLILRVRFADQPAGFEPQSEASTVAMASAAGAFLAENSEGRFTIQTTVSPVYTLPNSAQWYRTNDVSGYAENVLAAARAVGAAPQGFAGNAGLGAYDFREFDLEVVRYQGGPGSFAGQGYVDARGIWLKTDSAGVLAHEIGHNLGLWHANAWRPHDPQTITGPGANLEYGDAHDTMGASPGGHRHFNMLQKAQLGWIAAGSVVQSPSEGVLAIRAHDIVSDSAFPRAVVLRSGGRDLWLEFRRHPGWGANPWIGNGLGVRWGPWDASNGGTQLLDMTPFTPEAETDAPLGPGAMFVDPVAGIALTVLGRTGPAEESLQVDVRRTAATSNLPPVVALEASAEAPGVGSAVVFEARASDPDGDALAFAWETADGVTHPNAQRITTSWSSPGARRVRVVVSDRRGARASDSVVVRVGGVGDGLVAGTVLDLDGRPVPEARVSNGFPVGDPRLRQAFSDSDGAHALVGTPPGDRMLRAQRPGWLFFPLGFRNPLEAADEAPRADFVGLEAGHRVSGTVRAADGAPIVGALVAIADRSEPTDTSGGFVIEGVPAGRHVVTTTAAGREFEPREVEVRGGDVAGTDFRERVFTLTGEVRGVDGTTQVTVTDGTRATTAVWRQTSEGPRLTFSLPGVPGGARTIVALAAAGSFLPSSFANPLAVSASSSDGLVFQREGETTRFVTGRVVDARGGVAAVRVFAGGREGVTDADGRYFVTGLGPGSHALQFERAGWTFTPAVRIVAGGDASVGLEDVVAHRANGAPSWLALPAVVGEPFGTHLSLSARADDDGGRGLLRYSWSVAGTPPGPVLFSSSGRNSSGDTVAFFGAAGDHVIRVTATDAEGEGSSAEVAVAVRPTIHRIRIENMDAHLDLGAVRRLVVRCSDQFGDRMEPAAAPQWSVSGGGEIDTTGLLSARTVGDGFRVRATIEGRWVEKAFSVGHPPGGGSGLVHEIWRGVAGTGLDALRSAPGFPASPTVATLRDDGLEIKAGAEGNLGRRLRGYFIPPATGEHVFRIAADSAAELWLSPDADPAARVLVASVPAATGVRRWDEFASQRSAAVRLERERPVYLEVLHKAGEGGGHLAVGVDLPGGVAEDPVPASRLIPWGRPAFGPPRIVLAASATPSTVGAELTTSLEVAAESHGGEGSLIYRWEVLEPAPGPVAFLPNGSGDSSRTRARFARSGDHLLRVTVLDTAGQSAASRVLVRVNETLASWRRLHFSATELDTPAFESTRWGPEADPDGDGIPNLLEYAYGLDPLVAGTEGAPVASFVSVAGVEHLAISFRRNPFAADLVYTPEVTSDLTNWEGGLAPFGDPTGEWVTYRDLQPASEHRRRFVRVTVSGP